MTAAEGSLTGQVAAVTGAGSGIGRAVAERLAMAGATVICADLEEASARGTEEAIRSAGGTAHAVALDVTNRDQVHTVLREQAGALGGLHVMCNIAGVSGDGSMVVDLTEVEFDRVLAVHLKGVLFGSQIAGILMSEQRRGVIINMSSTAIDTPRPTLGAYIAAKSAIAGLTKVLALELGPAGVRVNAVAPGFIVTPLALARFTSDDGTIDVEARASMELAMREMSPLGRLGATADVAELIVYLASDAGAFVTGQTLRVNGGASMPW